MPTSDEESEPSLATISRALTSREYRTQVDALAKFFDEFFPHAVVLGIHSFFLYLAVVLGRIDFFLLGLLSLTLSSSLSLKLEAKRRGLGGPLEYLRRFDRKALAAFLELAFYPPMSLLYGALALLLIEFTGDSPTRIQDASAVLFALVASSLVFTWSYAARKPGSRTGAGDDDTFSLAGLAAALSVLGVGSALAVNHVLLLGSGGVILLVLIGWGIRRFVRMSGHLLMLSFIVAGLALFVDPRLFLGSTLLVPVVWCRLYLHRHTPLEVLLGTLVGTLVPLAGFLLAPILPPTPQFPWLLSGILR